MRDVIESIKHPTIAAAREALGEAGAGRASCFAVEGPKLLLEAIAAEAPITRAFFLHPRAEAEEPSWEAAQRAGIEAWLVKRGVFSRLLGLGYETATRVLTVVTITRAPLEELLAVVTGDTCLLAGERIQDPRNVGVLIRTADAWGLKAIAFTEGSADAFSRASVRSTTGSILRVRVTAGVGTAELLRGLRERSVRVIGTSAGATEAPWSVKMARPCAIVVGNESEGLTEEARDLCDVMTRIPMYGGAHSFNVTVAAGMLLYEAARQQGVRSES